jgi:hypothetical protein
MAFQTTGRKKQTSLLLDHFKVRDSISNMEAQALFRIRALPRRISDLEVLGHLFRREMRHDSTGQRYVRYFYTGRLGKAAA